MATEKTVPILAVLNLLSQASDLYERAGTSLIHFYYPARSHIIVFCFHIS